MGLILLSIWSDLFNEFLYGTGAWIGCICLLAIIILVTTRVKYSGMLFTVVSIFLGIMYLDNLAVNSNFMWIAIIMFLTSLYCVYFSIHNVYESTRRQ